MNYFGNMKKYKTNLEWSADLCAHNVGDYTVKNYYSCLTTSFDPYGCHGPTVCVNFFFFFAGYFSNIF